MKQRRVTKFVFWAYCAVMALLLFGRIRFVIQGDYWSTLSQHLNLSPFHTIQLFTNVLLGDYTAELRRDAIVNLAGNVVMFLPLGFLPPVLWKGFRKFWKMLLWGTVIILCVEGLQLFALVGKWDIDDLLLNLVGIAMGYGLYRLAVWMDKGKKKWALKD